MPGLGWIFTHVLTLWGSGYGWINPLVGVMVYFVFAILRPTLLWRWESWPTDRHSFFVAIAVIVGWALNGFGEWGRLRPIRVPLLGLALFIAMAVLSSVIWPAHRPSALEALNIQLKILGMVFIAFSVLKGERSIQAFAFVMVLAMGYLAYEYNRYYFSGFNLVHTRGHGGNDNNGFALIVGMGVPLSFFMGVHCLRRWTELKDLAKAALFGVIALLQIHLVLFSFSRGAQLGLCITGALTFVVAMSILPRKGLILLLASLTVVVGLWLAGDEVRERFGTIFLDKSQRDASANSRYDTWGAALRCIKDHPLGVGLRGYNAVASRYGLTDGKSAHSLWLQNGADVGIPGVLGLATFFIGTVWACVRTAVHPVAKAFVWPRYFCVMTALSLTGFCVNACFIGPTTVEECYIIACIGLATVAHVRELADEGIAHDITPAEASRLVPELAQVPLPALLPA